VCIVTKHRGFALAALAGLALAAGCAKEKANEAAEAAKPAAAPAAQPAAPAYAVEAPDSLRALAKIAVDSAAKLALAHVPNGAIDKVELEREKNALIWSFDIKVPGQEGISEVNVNAVTGAVAPTEHENAAAEAREARQDSAAARRPAAPARPAAPTTKRP
jgi:uncharacterized membrane protein YkoI